MLKELKNELIKTLGLLKQENLADDEQSNPTSLDVSAVQISDKAVGGKVELINADGSLSVAPDGEYILSDGFHFIVKDGLISEVIDDSTDANEDMADDSNEGGDSADAAPENDDEIKQAIAQNQQAISDLQKEIDAIKQLLEQLSGNVNVAASKEDVDKFKSEVVKLNETIVKLAKLPVENTKVNNSTVAKDKKDAKIMDFIKTIKREHE